MKTVFQILTAFLFLTSPLLLKASSTGEILGQVKLKETGKPIAFAEISFENRMDKVEVVANEYGYYYADHIPTGRYQMRIKFNNRTFVMIQVRVYDRYASKIDPVLSSLEELPSTVILDTEVPELLSVSSAGITLTENTLNQPTRSLEEALSMEPGVDVVNGKIFVKGSDQVRIFIDGTPVIGQPMVGQAW